MTEKRAERGIPASVVETYKKELEANLAYRVAHNACTKSDPRELFRKDSVIDKFIHVFEHQVPGEAKPITNQQISGRCWIFAAMNCMRLPFMVNKDIEEFELSQSYLFFWQKKSETRILNLEIGSLITYLTIQNHFISVELMNNVLNVNLEAAKKKTPVKKMQDLLQGPCSDGGYWNFLVNLVEKYGVMPKDCFPDVYISDTSKELEVLLNNKMREYYLTLLSMVEESGSTDAQLHAEIDKMRRQLFRIISTYIGIPPEKFTWEYRTKEEKKYEKIGPITPLEFYTKNIKPYFNAETKVVLGNYPGWPYNIKYISPAICNMQGGRPDTFFNLPIEELKSMAKNAIMGGQAVWFACDVSQVLFTSWKKNGISDTHIYDYKDALGTSFLGMTKADRYATRESIPNHAMVLTGFGEQDGKTKWRVENSWGAEKGAKGYLLMTDDYFTEFVFEVVVDERFVLNESWAIQKTYPGEVFDSTRLY